MKNKFLERSSETKPLPRDHSPYCEATGPIVHEGFVAARIKDFQALQNEPPGRKRSHSPMISCPVPSWFKIYEPQTPPKTISTHSRNTQKGSEHSRSSAVTRFGNRDVFEKQENHCKAERRRSFSGKAVSEGEETILGPRAIPAELVTHLDTPTRSQSKATCGKNTAKLRQMLRSRRSVAEKLGSLVDRGWTQRDFLDDAFDETKLFGPPSPDFFTESTQRLEKSQSFESILSRFKQSEKKLAAPALTSQNTHQDEASTNCGIGSQGADAPLPKLRDPATRQSYETYTGEKLSPRTRMWTMHSTDRPLIDRHKGLQRRTLSLSQMIDRHLSDWTNMEIHHAFDAEPAEINLLSSPELASDSSLRSFDKPGRDKRDQHVERSERSARRSASWFSKLPRYRLAIKDRMPTLRNFSRKTSDPTLGSEDALVFEHGSGGDAVDSPIKLQDLSSSRRERHKYESNVSDQEGLVDPSDSNPPASTNADVVLPGPDCSTKIYHKNDLQPQTKLHSPNRLGSDSLMIGSPSSPEIDSYSDSLSPTSRRSGSQHASAEDFKILAEDQFQQHGPASSKSASAGEMLESGKETSVTPSRQSSLRTPTKAFPQKSLAAEINDDQKERIELSDSQTPNRTGESGDSVEATEAIHLETTGKGRGIRRVQVIVSLDGADNLYVEATLVKRPKKSS